MCPPVEPLHDIAADARSRRGSCTNLHSRYAGPTQTRDVVYLTTAERDEPGTHVSERQQPRRVAGLGSLEARVMDVLWDTTEALTVRDILQRLPDQLAYTTILTVVSHLFEKQWVERIMHRRAYLYRPAQTRAEATAQALRRLIDDSNDPEAVLLHFATTVSPAESEAFKRGLLRRSKPKSTRRK